MNKILEANNFNNSQVLDRVVPSPSIYKLLLSEYGNIKIYENSKELSFLSNFNAFVASLFFIALICLSSVFLFIFSSTTIIFKTGSIITLTTLSILIAYCLFNIFVIILGISWKNIWIKKKIGFDSLLTNLIIGLVLIISLRIFAFPILIQNPLIPTTYTEIKTMDFLMGILESTFIILSLMCGFNLLIIIWAQLIKNKIVREKIKKIMIDATSINSKSFAINLDKDTVNKIIFEKVK